MWLSWLNIIKKINNWKLFESIIIITFKCIQTHKYNILNDSFIISFPGFIVIIVSLYILLLSLFPLVLIIFLREFIAKHSDILLRNTLYHSDNQPSLRHLPLSYYCNGSRHSLSRCVNRIHLLSMLGAAKEVRSGLKSCTEESACYRRVDSKNKVVNCTAKTRR